MNEQEIWIRLSLVNKVALEKVIEIISYLKQRNKVTHSILKECGLNEMQRLQFFHVPQQRIEITTRWLQNKENQMITVSAPPISFFIEADLQPSIVIICDR
ncbi:Uncharacterised protein [Providencia rustigianii]|nr:Uncharacterised protein [Providencia rustigianii]